VAPLRRKQTPLDEVMPEAGLDGLEQAGGGLPRVVEGGR
jgi:hypothetical protein